MLPRCFLFLGLVASTLAGAVSHTRAASAPTSMIEADRIHRLKLLKLARPTDWPRFVDEHGQLTPAGQKIVDDYLAKTARKVLMTQDFKRARQILARLASSASATVPVDKAAEALSDELGLDAHVRNGMLYDMTLTNSKMGLSISAGQLYVDGRHPLAQPSPYANVNWGKSDTQNGLLDYNLKASLGYIDLHSRYFSDDSNSDVSPLSRMFPLATQLGAPADTLSSISQNTTYQDPYQAQGIAVSSLLAQVGHAYRLVDPVDLCWSAGSLVKTMWLARNAAFDETLGLRFRAKDISFGLFGGVAQNVSPVDNDALSQMLENNTFKLRTALENDPHAGLAVWGDIPGARNLKFSASATQRWTPVTEVSEGQASLATAIGGHPLTLKGIYRPETGPTVGFDREKTNAEIDYGFKDSAEASLSYQRDLVRYGNASVDSEALLAGFKVDLGGHSRLTIDELVGGRYHDNAAPENRAFQKRLAQIQKDLSSAVDALDQIKAAYQDSLSKLGPSELEGRLNQISRALSRLSPDEAGPLIDQLGLTPEQRTELGQLWLKTVSPDSPYYQQLSHLLTSDLNLERDARQALGKIDDWSNYFTTHEGHIRALIGLLADEKMWDAAILATARNQLITAIAKSDPIKIPIFGKDLTLRLGAPTVLVISNALQSRLSLPSALEPGLVNAWLLREAGAELGLTGTPTSQQLADALSKTAREQIQQELSKDLAPLENQLDGLDSREALASKILASAPPNIAALLRQDFGPDLAQLIPPDLSGKKLKAFLDALPDQIASDLQKHYGNDLAHNIAHSISWVGDLLSREINRTLIELMLASEELDRLTVDRGQKIDDLDLRQAMRSFDALDDRGRQEARKRLGEVKTMLIQKNETNEARLAAKFESYGKASLTALELSASWPQGLTVEVDEGAWMPLITLYGQGRFFDLIEQLGKKYEASRHPQGLMVSFGYQPEGSTTMVLRRDNPPFLKIELPRPQSEQEAQRRLLPLVQSLN